MRLEKKSFSSPDEVRPMSGKGQVEILKVGNGVVGKATFEPGWRWSEARSSRVVPRAPAEITYFSAMILIVLPSRVRATR